MLSAYLMFARWWSPAATAVSALSQLTGAVDFRHCLPSKSKLPISLWAHPFCGSLGQRQFVSELVTDQGAEGAFQAL